MCIRDSFWGLPQFDTEPSDISVGRVLGPRAPVSRRLASEDDSVHSHFHGYIDELRLYESALSAEDVLDDYNEGAAMPPATPCESSICDSAYDFFEGEIVCHYSGTCELADNEGSCAAGYERCEWTSASMPATPCESSVCYAGEFSFNLDDIVCHDASGHCELADTQGSCALGKERCEWTSASMPATPCESSICDSAYDFFEGEIVCHYLSLIHI